MRIREESRTNTAVLDPTTGEQTEINERGPAVTPKELELFRDKLLYLARGAEIVVFAGSLPRGVEPDVYAELIRELRKLGVDDVVDTDGDPLRHAVRAEPTSSRRTCSRPRSSSATSSTTTRTCVVAVREMVQLGAREAIMTLARRLLRAACSTTASRALLPRPDRAARAGRHGRLGRRVPRRLRRRALRGLGAGGVPALRRRLRRGVDPAPRRRPRRPARGRAARCAEVEVERLEQPAEV